MRHILITGATGTLGSELVPLFCREPDTLLYLLIRSKSEAELQNRIQKLLAYLEIEAEQAAKIIPIRGDVSEPQLGMSPEGYQELCVKCTHVIHAAASIKLNMTPEEAQRATFVPAENILEFISACRKSGQFEKFDYVSTVGVAGKMQGLVEERFFPEVREFHNNYEKYKAGAEALVWEQMQAGLPATIHRPSMIVGNSRNGRIMNFQGFYFLVRFFSGEFTRGFLPNLPKLTIDTVPVDYVAEGIHWSVFNSAALGKIMHYSSAKKSIPVVEFIQLVRKSYSANNRPLPALRLINPELFVLSLRVIRICCFGRLRSLLRQLLLFLGYRKNEQVFDNKNTAMLLSQHGIATPAPTDYLPLVIGYFLKNAKR